MKPTYSDSNGKRFTTPQIDRRSNRAAKELLEEQRINKGYNYCESCGINSTASYIDVSHTVSRKEAKEKGNVEILWDKSNLEIICRNCHNKKDGLDLKFK